MSHSTRTLLIGLGLICALSAGGALGGARSATAAEEGYVVLGWNDLGMHCYNKDVRDLAVLPPFNTLWVQVVKAGNPPTLVTSGISVYYTFKDNSYSVGKTNFWSYEQALFGVNLPPNVGLTGNGLSGKMQLETDHFVASGIPLTEFNDSSPTTSEPYQLAMITVKDSASGRTLARQRVVAPVSSEMRCNGCHGNNGPANPTIATGRVATNILKLHDRKEGTQLMNQRPVLCANCHGSNALGMGGDPALPNLSNAMHGKHTGVVPNSLNGCYKCHPGPQTRCLRDVMSQEEGMDCISCHGPMQQVARNADPWLNEPRCDTCHDQAQNAPLYRFSTGHGGLYCEACHDSTHAIAPSRVARDGLKFIALQGEDGPLSECSVCHTIMGDEMDSETMLELHVGPAGN